MVFSPSFLSELTVFPRARSTRLRRAHAGRFQVPRAHLTAIFQIAAAYFSLPGTAIAAVHAPEVPSHAEPCCAFGLESCLGARGGLQRWQCLGRGTEKGGAHGQDGSEEIGCILVRRLLLALHSCAQAPASVAFLCAGSC